MKLTPAQKAAKTRRARKDFYNCYPKTAFVAELLLKDRPAEYVALATNSTAGQVAAVKANLSREGDFKDMAMACNY